MLEEEEELAEEDEREENCIFEPFMIIVIVNVVKEILISSRLFDIKS